MWSHGVSIGSLFIIFLIAVLLFGVKRLRLMAKDLGVALRNVSSSMRSSESTDIRKEKAEKVESDYT